MREEYAYYKPKVGDIVVVRPEVGVVSSEGEHTVLKVAKCPAFHKAINCCSGRPTHKCSGYHFGDERVPGSCSWCSSCYELAKSKDEVFNLLDDQ